MYKDFSKLSFFDNYESLFYSVSLQNMVSIVPVSLARDNAYVQNGQIIMKPLCDYPTEIQYYCVNHKKVSVLEKRCLELILNLLK